MRVTTKGQVTIPQDIRERLGILPHSEVVFDVVGDSVRIRKKKGSKTRGQLLIEHLRRGPKPMPGMTTDELMAMTRGED
ncbi:MAG TPA: AbrB/MazE/SpoVT family DNA-binding domain-containing protein [Vicinamibacterales bacterium]|nr:AbrB/MazE/SpoVT family DNA-binding domain-containing protein [Vicinamibacterales bacterium]